MLAQDRNAKPFKAFLTVDGRDGFNNTVHVIHHGGEIDLRFC